MKPQNLTSEQKRDIIVAAAQDKKANYLTEMDLRGQTIIADFFVICSGTSNIHIRSVADGIVEEMVKYGIRRSRIEGYGEASWVILDYGDVIVHVMSEEQRDTYKLEKLWSGQEAQEAAPPPLEGPDQASEHDEVLRGIREEDIETLGDQH